MRQAADILSSAPAMQIRYLEAMQAMAKSANSKVIFLTMPTASQFAAGLDKGSGFGEGSGTKDNINFGDLGGHDGFQQAINARVVENI
jgi:hypothetical protein